MRIVNKRRVLALLLVLTMLMQTIRIVGTDYVYAAENGSDVSDASEVKEKPSDEYLCQNVKLADESLHSSRIFDYVDEKQFEGAGHLVRLDTAEQLNTYVFLNEDGTNTTYMMSENVKFINHEGKTLEKDLTLVKTNEGYTTRANDVEIMLPFKLNNGVETEYKGYKVKVSPSELSKDCLEASQVDNAIIYKNALGKGLSLRYTPLLSGVKEDIILEERVDSFSTSFIIKSNNIRLVKENNSILYLDKDTNELIFQTGALEIYDSNGKLADSECRLEEISDEETLLTITVDNKFLSEADTVFPVIVDPTLTISDTASGANSIIDAPIFQGRPNENFGTYEYDRVGTPAGSFGVGRTVVRLNGLTSTSAYQNATASTISEVKFYCKEATGTSTMKINLHPLLGTTSWTESNVTWNNVGSYSSSDYGANMPSGAWVGFDITSFVKGWKGGAITERGFLLKNSTESYNKCFYSSEHTTTSARPYVTFTYTVPAPPVSVSLNKSSVSVEEGSSASISIIASGANAVNWYVSHSSIVTITQSSSNMKDATVRGVSVGTATIIGVAMIGTAGYSATCPVTVTEKLSLDSGLYYIQNKTNNNNVLEVKDFGIFDGSTVWQKTRFNSTDDKDMLNQWWLITNVGNDYYTIRPLNMMKNGMYASGTNVKVKDIGTTPYYMGIASDALWTITRVSGTQDYVIKNYGDNSKTLYTVSGATGVDAKLGTYSSSDSKFRWKMSKITEEKTGAVIYDNSGNRLTSEVIRSIDVENRNQFACDEITLSQLGLIVSGYNGMSCAISTSFSLHNSSLSNIAGVNSSTGNVILKSFGQVEIDVKYPFNPSQVLTSFTLRINIKPNPDAQNKTNWCWAASAKKVVAHNDAIREDLLGESWTENSGFNDSYNGCRYKNSEERFRPTVDKVQKSIVVSQHGGDGNYTGNANNIKDAMEYISENRLYTEVVNCNSINAVNRLIYELGNGKYVVGSFMSNDINQTVGHAIAITGYDNGWFEYYDPWRDYSYSFSCDDLVSRSVDLLYRDDLYLDSFIIGYREGE